jgi:hypothetical protein
MVSSCTPFTVASEYDTSCVVAGSRVFALTLESSAHGAPNAATATPDESSNCQTPSEFSASDTPVIDNGNVHEFPADADAKTIDSFTPYVSLVSFSVVDGKISL